MNDFDLFEREQNLVDGLVEWSSNRISREKAFNLVESFDSGKLKDGLAFIALKSASEPLYKLNDE